MNTIYVSGLGKWIRLDARGNKEGRPLYERLGFTESTEGMVLEK